MATFAYDPHTSLRNNWARQKAIHGVQDVWNGFVDHYSGLGFSKLEGNELPDFEKVLPDQGQPKGLGREVRIGIVGAGAAGLFTAMVLDYLNKQLAKRNDLRDFKFRYIIYEANPENRLGGRLFTYKFSETDHNYYDVGAMRFPENPVMKRVFDLFGKLEMEKVNDFKNHPDAKDGSLIPYYMTNKIEPWRYNDVNRWGGSYKEVREQSQDNDPFAMLCKDYHIPENIRCHSPNGVMKSTIVKLREALEDDLKQKPPGRKGWELLMSYDRLSTRDYLGTAPSADVEKILRQLEEGSAHAPDQIPQPPYNYDTIQWMETFNGGTDWYDQAHSETVLENLDFDYEENTPWWCILGGAQMLAKKMYQKIDTVQVFLETSVTAIRARSAMNVELEFKTPTWTGVDRFDAVFNTTTLGCLGKMDISEAGLNYGVKQACRGLGYGQSAKVAIHFKSAWWIHSLGDKFNIKQGGLGHSDLMIRTCVYPSYNIYVEAGKPATLLCSYTWQQDSDRIASQFADENKFKELLIRELTRLHKNEDMKEEALEKLIRDNYIKHHAYDWTRDPTTMGAFAFFRPQQFSCMWPKLIQPSGDVVIAGEAASPHHAWVVGALESVIHGLHSWMSLRKGMVKGFEEAIKILETIEEGNPFTGLPPYMDPNLSRWNSLAGLIGSQGVEGNASDFLSHFANAKIE